MAAPTPVLCDRGDGGYGRGCHVRAVRHGHIVADLAVGVLLRAVSRNVARFAALVARLASSVEGSSVGRSAVTRDVAELATGVTLHSLGLAVSCEMVRATAFVARRRSRASGEAATAVPSRESATTDRTTSAHRDPLRVRASTLRG